MMFGGINTHLVWDIYGQTFRLGGHDNEDRWLHTVSEF